MKELKREEYMKISDYSYGDIESRLRNNCEEALEFIAQGEDPIEGTFIGSAYSEVMDMRKDNKVQQLVGYYYPDTDITHVFKVGRNEYIETIDSFELARQN